MYELLEYHSTQNTATQLTLTVWCLHGNPSEGSGTADMSEGSCSVTQISWGEAEQTANRLWQHPSACQVARPSVLMPSKNLNSHNTPIQLSQMRKSPVETIAAFCLQAVTVFIPAVKLDILTRDRGGKIISTHQFMEQLFNPWTNMKMRLTGPSYRWAETHQRGLFSYDCIDKDYFW